MTEVIAGRYEVIEVLNPDSISMTYLCRHRELDGLAVLVKPETIFLSEEGTVRIAPSFIAIVSDKELTETGGVVGAIDCVAPEYLQTGETTALGDIYAFGVLGYELLTGKSPFTGRSVIETMTKRLEEDPEPLTVFRRDCPQELSYIVLRAMRAPADRFQNGREIANALHALQG